MVRVEGGGFTKIIEVPDGKEREYCLWEKVGLAKEEIRQMMVKKKPEDICTCRFDVAYFTMDGFTCARCNKPILALMEEKPKCWCETEDGRKWGRTPINMMTSVVRLNFCPECGRKL